jgi:DNA polymerase I
MSRLLVIDTPNFLMRAHHMVPGAAQVALMLKRVLRHVSPTHLLMAMDSQGPTFRAEAFAGYKASRAEKGGVRSSEVVAAILPSLLDWGMVVAREEGFEADDVLATVAARGVAAGSRVFLLSNDSDVLQLVSPDVCVLRAENGGRLAAMTPDAVRSRIGVGPQQVCDYKALAGDSSDDIPRVALATASGRMRGITKDGAADLLRRYASLEGVYAAIEQLPAREGEWLLACREQAFFFRDLVRLRSNLSLAGVDPRLSTISRLTLPGPTLQRG